MRPKNKVMWATYLPPSIHTQKGNLHLFILKKDQQHIQRVYEKVLKAVKCTEISQALAEMNLFRTRIYQTKQATHKFCNVSKILRPIKKNFFSYQDVSLQYSNI